MAKADLLKQVAEANQKNKDLRSKFKVKPVADGNYVTKITDVTFQNTRFTVVYGLSDEEGNSYTVKETYSNDAVDMFLDKQSIIATIYNKEKNEPINTERDIDELINFEFVANVTQSVNDTYINWRVTPFPPKKED